MRVNNVSAILYTSFAKRVADTGRDPIPIMQSALLMMKDKPLSELIWASPRELLNIFQAYQIDCHIITITHNILKKIRTRRL